MTRPLFVTEGDDDPRYPLARRATGRRARTTSMAAARGGCAMLGARLRAGGSLARRGDGACPPGPSTTSVLSNARRRRRCRAARSSQTRSASASRRVRASVVARASSEPLEPSPSLAPSLAKPRASRTWRWRRALAVQESSWGDPGRWRFCQTMRIQWSRVPGYAPRVRPADARVPRVPRGHAGGGGGPVPGLPAGNVSARPVLRKRHERRGRHDPGYRGFGVDVSPLAAFVAAHRAWRPARGERHSTRCARSRARPRARRRWRRPRRDCCAKSEPREMKSEEKRMRATAHRRGTKKPRRRRRGGRASRLATGAFGAVRVPVSIQRRRRKGRRERTPARRRRRAGVPGAPFLPLRGAAALAEGPGQAAAVQAAQEKRREARARDRRDCVDPRPTRGCCAVPRRRGRVLRPRERLGARGGRGRAARDHLQRGRAHGDFRGWTPC